MPRTSQLLGESTIASTDAEGPSAGNPIKAASHTMLAIQAPEETTGDCFLEGSFDEVEWRRVQCYGLDVALPANRLVLVDAVAAPYLRAASEVPEFSDRTFVFWSILDI